MTFYKHCAPPERKRLKLCRNFRSTVYATVAQSRLFFESSIHATENRCKALRVMEKVHETNNLYCERPVSHHRKFDCHRCANRASDHLYRQRDLPWRSLLV